MAGLFDKTQPILEKKNVEEGVSETSAVLKDEPFSILDPNAKPNETRPTPVDGNYFDDGITKIDFVLVYKETFEAAKAENNGTEPEESFNVYNQHKKWREKFIKALSNQGMKIETHKNISTDGTIYFLKLSCTWELLVRYAEELNFKAPLQLTQYKSGHWLTKILKILKIPNIMENEIPNPPAHYFTCDFKKSKLHKYLGGDDPDNYFSNTERARVAWEVLQNTVYGTKKITQLGIKSLLSKGVFAAAFPLHDTDEVTDAQEMDPTKMNSRQILHKYWANWSMWYKYQPLHHIRKYFGEKIAYYFAWLGFYTAWLLPAALVGLIVFIVGAARINTDIPSIETCQNGQMYQMCPKCDTCEPWNLSKQCLKARLLAIFDNVATVFFATFMAFWAVCFMEFWKRRNNQLSHLWEVEDYEYEHILPQYRARATYIKINAVTEIQEPRISNSQSITRRFTGYTILLIMIIVVFIFVFAILIYKATIGLMMLEHNKKANVVEVGVIKAVTGAILNLIVIQLMGKVYSKVAVLVTNWETHRTEENYENSLILKNYIFQCVNYYSAIVYVAFFKGRFSGYPGHYANVIGLRVEPCGYGGCIADLTLEFFVIMIGRQIIKNTEELLIPALKRWWKLCKIEKDFSRVLDHEFTKQSEKDYYDLLESKSLRDEYLEMRALVLNIRVVSELLICAILMSFKMLGNIEPYFRFDILLPNSPRMTAICDRKFGFVTFFVAAFPLAPLFALFNNWIEIRLDARKFVLKLRRPVAERARHIGIWYKILEVIVQLAVITNAALIAFTSDIIPRMFYKYKVGHGTMHGYTNFTLSYAPAESGLNFCRYAGYRDMQGQFTKYFYQLLCWKLAFVIIFEHAIFFVGRLIDWSIPDKPEMLKIIERKENYLAKQALLDTNEV